MITPTAAFVVQELLRRYDKGIFTKMETLQALVDAAANYAPGDLAAAMPPEWLARVHQAVANPPCSPDEGVYIGSALLRAGTSREEWLSEMSQKRQKWFNSIWTWHRYFIEKATAPTDPND